MYILNKTARGYIAITRCVGSNGITRVQRINEMMSTCLTTFPRAFHGVRATRDSIMSRGRQRCKCNRGIIEADQELGLART